MKRLGHNCLSYIKIQTILHCLDFFIGNEDESIASEKHSAFLRAAGEPPHAKNARDVSPSLPPAGGSVFFLR